MKKFKWLACLILPVFLSTGCNTIRGFGKDIAKIGTSIQNTADKASQNRTTYQQPNQYSPYAPTNNSQYYDPYYNPNLPQPVYNNYH